MFAHILGLVLSAAVLVVVAGCRSDASPTPTRDALAQPANYSLLTWPTERVLVVTLERLHQSRAAQVVIPGGSPDDIAQPNDARCVSGSVRLVLPIQADPGRATFVRRCIPLDGSADNLVTVDAFEPASGTWTTLDELPGSPGATAWQPGSDFALVSVGSGICNGIGLARDGRVEPWAMSVEDDGSVFEAGDDLRRDPTLDCGAFGRADWPVFDLDRKRVAFFAAATSGAVGQSRLDEPWNLYVADRVALTSSKVASEITHARLPLWSRDGDRLFFVGQPTESRMGVHVVDVRTRAVTPLWFGEVGWIALSPDGAQLAVVPVAVQLDQPVPILSVPTSGSGE